jgi:hypothetical protein
MRMQKREASSFSSNGCLHPTHSNRHIPPSRLRRFDSAFRITLAFCHQTAFLYAARIGDAPNPSRCGTPNFEASNPRASKKSRVELMIAEATRQFSPRFDSTVALHYLGTHSEGL